MAILLIIIGFAILSVFWVVKMNRVRLWLHRSAQENSQKERELTERGRLFILIPVLDEAKILEETVRYFSDIFPTVGNVKLVIATTEKEYSVRNRSGDTVELAKRLEKDYSDVVAFHYPDKNGKMAHQLNFAIKKINEIWSLDERDLIALYNADSRPDRRTFQWVISRYIHDKKEVFQQFGDYAGNLRDVMQMNIVRKSIVLSAMAWQNRWSLGFELPHSLTRLGCSRELSSIKCPVNYCIGHGLFLSYRAYMATGGFNERMHNEDAILGLQLDKVGMVIDPIPFFDEARVPDSVKGLFLQQASWFFGPLQAFEYYGELTRHHKRTDFRTLLLSAKLFSHALYWTIGPALFLIIFLSALWFPSMTHVVGLVVVWIFFLTMPSYIALTRAGKYKMLSSCEKIVLFPLLLLGMPVFYFLHGLAAAKSIADYILRFVVGRDIKKEKTLMLSEP